MLATVSELEREPHALSDAFERLEGRILRS
jgi:hypothetical protein